MVGYITGISQSDILYKVRTCTCISGIHVFCCPFWISVKISTDKNRSYGTHGRELTCVTLRIVPVVTALSSLYSGHSSVQSLQWSLLCPVSTVVTPLSSLYSGHSSVQSLQWSLPCPVSRVVTPLSSLYSGHSSVQFVVTPQSSYEVYTPWSGI